MKIVQKNTGMKEASYFQKFGKIEKKWQNIWTFSKSSNVNSFSVACLVVKLSKQTSEKE